MLTLEQAISHAREKAEELRAKTGYYTQNGCGYFQASEVEQKEIADCLECASEHQQLAEWLTELKARREAQEHDFCRECVYDYENTQVCKKCYILKPNMFNPKENDK